MIYIELFLAFLKIGAVSFGGGYGMISLVRETVLSNNWLTEGEFLDFVAISESTPGSMAVNMATFVGSSEGGIIGAAIATIGVVLPAFVIIVLIASIMKKVLKYDSVQSFLEEARACVSGLIISTGVVLGLGIILGISNANDKVSMNYTGVILLAILFAVDFTFAKMAKKKLSPIVLILISAFLGIVFF